MELSTKLAAVLVLTGLILGGGIGIGIGRGHPQVVEKTTHTETQLQTTVVNQKVDMDELSRLVSKLVTEQFANLQKNVKVDQTVDKKPDGSEVIHTVTTDNSTSQAGSKTTAEASSDTQKHGSASTAASSADLQLKVDEKFKQTTPSKGPTWALGVSATYQLRGTPAQPVFGGLLPERLTLALTVDHRFIGPLWLGAAVTSDLAVGGGLKLVF